jgi:transposase
VAYQCCPAHGKKSLIANERDETARQEFGKLTNRLASEPSVVIDEMGSPLGLTRRYGRAAPGQRVLAHVPGDRGGNGSTLGAIGLEGIRTGLSVPGAIDGETRLLFVEELLVPPLNRGAMVGRDNNPIHTRDESEEAIAAAGAWVLFLPTSSPALNPIELCWAKVNSRVRSRQPRTLADFFDALGQAFASIPPHAILHWVEPCGYQVASSRKSL